ncbi:MAG: hypothetical protein ACK452_07825 [Bacteroidota bacterium]
MNICKIIGRKKTWNSVPLINDYSFTIFERTEEINTDEWNIVNKPDNVFLSIEYLKILEKNDIETSKYFFVTIHKNDKIVGIAFFQLISFNAGIFGDLIINQLKNIKNESKNSSKTFTKKSNSSSFYQLLTLGNNYMSGEYGFTFVSDVDRLTQFEILEKLCAIISRREKLKTKISAVLVKDFYPDTLPVLNKFSNENYLQFSAEPNMYIEIPNEINSLTKYISLFSKKYRNRAKKILSLSKNIKIYNLNVSDLEQHKKSIYNLYLQVYNKAKFKLVKLNEDYFLNCKNNFGEKFIAKGYFLNDSLIGFKTAFIQSQDELEAHFIGFDYKLNKEFEIYQNILFGFIDLAIELRRKKLILGRTAAEIKSTTGAKASEMICFIKPQNSLSRLLLKPFIAYLQPSEWTPRNPFK